MRLVVIASLMLFSTAAWAAPSDTDADAAARRKADPKSKVDARYDFEDDDVKGDLRSPDHEGVRSKVTARHQSMIHLREHFIPQMLQMAHDV